jgi:hypothetical protein
VIGGFFLLLLAMRLAGTEELARSSLRRLLHVEGAYAGRRRVQGLVVVGALVAGASLIGFLALRAQPAVARSAGRARAMRLARVGVAALAALITVRMISLHAIDRLLYRGPHLNWVIDVGATLLVTAAALAYTRTSAAATHRRDGRR